LDFYIKEGFELVIPSIVEYDDNNLQSFKFLDGSSQKMLSVPADITPQIARIDAKQGVGVKKYCYISSILKTRADDFYASRSPIQAGAEIYGEDGSKADIQSIQLMLKSLTHLGMNDLVLNIGHVGLFSALVEAENISSEKAQQLKIIFTHKSQPDLVRFIQNNSLTYASEFSDLMRLEGGSEVLKKALEIFKNLPTVKKAIIELNSIEQALAEKNIQTTYDLGELKAYDYHTGVVFSLYHQDYSKALAQGGRYDNIGQNFSPNLTARAATGFSFDLKFLSETIRN
jgi:ATP phosphoribosyltransferase regulatory subunit